MFQLPWIIKSRALFRYAPLTPYIALVLFAISVFSALWSLGLVVVSYLDLPDFLFLSAAAHDIENDWGANVDSDGRSNYTFAPSRTDRNRSVGRVEKSYTPLPGRVTDSHILWT